MQALIAEIKILFRMRQLLWVMTRRELATKHAATALGWIWPYLQPTLTIAAYYLVFDVVFSMRMGKQAPTESVGAYLIVGALPWMAFCDGLSRAMNSLIEAGGVLQKNPLPPVLFACRAVLASTTIYVPLVLAVVVLYFPLHRGGLVLLAIVPLMFFQTALVALLGYALAILAAALRDVVQIVGFMLSVGIYLSPALFPISMFPQDWRWILWANPVTATIVGFQEVLLQGQWPTAMVWVASICWIGISAVVLSALIERSRDQLLDWL